MESSDPKNSISNKEDTENQSISKIETSKEEIKDFEREIDELLLVFKFEQAEKKCLERIKELETDKDKGTKLLIAYYKLSQVYITNLDLKKARSSIEESKKICGEIGLGESAARIYMSEFFLAIIEGKSSVMLSSSSKAFSFYKNLKDEYKIGTAECFHVMSACEICFRNIGKSAYYAMQGIEFCEKNGLTEELVYVNLKLSLYVCYQFFDDEAAKKAIEESLELASKLKPEKKTYKFAETLLTHAFFTIQVSESIIDDLRKSREIYLELTGKELSPHLALRDETLARAYIFQNKIDEAFETINRALLTMEQTVGKDCSDYANLLQTKSEIHKVKGEMDRRIELLIEAVEIKKKAQAEDNIYVTILLYEIAADYYDLMNDQKAVNYYLQVITNGVNHPTLDIVVVSNLRLGQLTTADEILAADFYKKALETSIKILDENPIIFYAGTIPLVFAELYFIDPLFNQAIMVWSQHFKLFKEKLTGNEKLLQKFRTNITQEMDFRLKKTPAEVEIFVSLFI